MTADYKVTELFCIIDEFCKHFDAENLFPFFIYSPCLMAWEENSHICLHMQLIAILSRIGVFYHKNFRYLFFIS